MQWNRKFNIASEDLCTNYVMMPNSFRLHLGVIISSDLDGRTRLDESGLGTELLKLETTLKSFPIIKAYRRPHFSIAMQLINFPRSKRPSLSPVLIEKKGECGE